MTDTLLIPDPVRSLPLLRGDRPGIGGSLKTSAEDFEVEEIPLYPASGEGTHTYLMIEKRGLSTPAAIRLLATALDRQPRDFGYAGLKDAVGVTRQVVSIEHIAAERISQLSIPDVTILWARQHGNKLKRGHLAGNRFRLTLRGCTADAEVRATAILDGIAKRGLPNYFGEQRFGLRGTNALIGAAALRGDWTEALMIMLGRPMATDSPAEREARTLVDAHRFADAVAGWPAERRREARLCQAVARQGPTERTWRQVDRGVRELMYHAVQSALFNAVVADRIGGLDRLESGDLAWLHRNGACFVVDNAETEQPRADEFEISPSGPLFGGRMSAPGGRPAEREQAILARVGHVLSSSRTPDGIRLDGARRPLRVPVTEIDIQSSEAGVLALSFVLPAGSYATVVARELTQK